MEGVSHATLRVHLYIKTNYLCTWGANILTGLPLYLGTLKLKTWQPYSKLFAPYLCMESLTRQI